MADDDKAKPPEAPPSEAAESEGAQPAGIAMVPGDDFYDVDIEGLYGDAYDEALEEFEDADEDEGEA